ncbi:MAG: hypothetical protein DRH70_05485 [Candidatus Coatesbacteria bacterium]|nr:MAG: hypothetical protein DRH70_05485 [Candidatus Coatesbacteria bacterium]
MPRGAICCAVAVLLILFSTSVMYASEVQQRLATPVLHGRVMPEGMQTELSWDGVPGAYNYLIERDSSPDFDVDPSWQLYRIPAASHYVFRDTSISEEMQTLYYRIKAEPSQFDLTAEESNFSNVVALTPIDPTADPDVKVLITPASFDFQTFIFHKQLTVKNMSSKPLKISLWPNTEVIALSTYGFWLDPWQSGTVGVSLDRTSLEPGLYTDFAISFLSNAGTVAPPPNQDGKIEIEAQVAGPVEVSPIGPYFLRDDTPNHNGLIDSGEKVNCQFKMVNTDRNVEALDLTVRIIPKANVESVDVGAVTHINNLPPMGSVYVPFSFTAAPVYFGCDSAKGPVVNGEFLVVVSDTFGYSWEQTVNVGICTPPSLTVVNFAIDDDNQGASATVPHTHNKMIESGEIIEARVTFMSNYELLDGTLSLSDDQHFSYLPRGDSFSYKDVDDLKLIPSCGEVTPDRDFEFRAVEYDASPITFRLTVDASIAPGVDYADNASYPVTCYKDFVVNSPFGPEVTVTSTNYAPRMVTDDSFTIYANVRNLGPKDVQADLYVAAIYQGQIFYLGGATPTLIPTPLCPSIYLTRKTPGPKRILAYHCPGVLGWSRTGLLFASVLQVPGEAVYNQDMWYSFDWTIVNINY